MQTLQFKTYVKNGTIKIPEPFQEWQNRELTVILLIPEETNEHQQITRLRELRKGICWATGEDTLSVRQAIEVGRH